MAVPSHNLVVTRLYPCMAPVTSKSIEPIPGGPCELFTCGNRPAPEQLSARNIALTKLYAEWRLFQRIKVRFSSQVFRHRIASALSPRLQRPLVVVTISDAGAAVPEPSAQ